MCNELKKFTTKYTIITKDGNKWLRPVNPNEKYLIDELGRYRNPYHRLFSRDNPDIPYIGNRPEGTVLDEGQVRKITQVEDYPEWITPHPDNLEDWLDTSHEIRTVYVDAEPECLECGKYCSCPEEDLYDAVADYRINHPEPSRDRQVSPDKCVSGCTSYYGGEVRHHTDCPFYPESFTRMHDYWKSRCEAAERYINESPCDPDITKAQWVAYEAWQEIVNQQPK